MPDVLVCRVDACAKPRKMPSTLCSMHKARWSRFGSLELPHRPSIEERFWQRVTQRGDCWIWTGHLTPEGYGTFHPSRELGGQQAHRFAYELLIAPVPLGLELDHLCHNADLRCPGGPTCPHRACVNPYHLEPLTSSENTRRREQRKRLVRALAPSDPATDTGGEGL